MNITINKLIKITQLNFFHNLIYLAIAIVQPQKGIHFFNNM